MSVLIFTSTEPGAAPRGSLFQIADVLNRHGIETYYVSTCEGEGNIRGTDVPAWDLSAEFRGSWRARLATERWLRRISVRYGVTGCLATGVDASLVAKAGIPYNYWSYGWDLDTSCFWPYPPSPMRQPNEWRRFVYSVRRIHRARRSIRFSNAVMIAAYQYDALQRVAPNKRLFFLPHIITAPALDIVLERKRRAKAKLQDKFQAGRLFFSSSRQVWGAEWDENRGDKGSVNKGNDLMVRSFVEYQKRRGHEKAKLMFIRKGPSVGSTIKLAQELGVSDDIVWLEAMKQADLAEYYYGSDLCFGQFGTPVIVYSSLEPLSFGTPVISFIGEAQDPRVPTYSELPPLFSSLDPAAIAAWMERATAPDEAARRERTSWDWIARHCSEAAFCESFVREMSDRAK